MIPSHRIATHPGIILLKEFPEPMGLSQKAIAAHIDIPVQRINEIVRGKRGVSPDTAWLLGQAFNTSPEFWLSLQATYDCSCCLHGTVDSGNPCRNDEAGAARLRI